MRAKSAGARKVAGDVKYNSLEVAKLINRVMLDGKKTVAEKQVYQALKASDLDWTFFAPAGTIAPGTRTGRFRLGQDVLISAADGTSSISAEDYAAAFVDELETPKNRRSIMTIGY